MHSERQPGNLKHSACVNHGIALRAALPRADEACPPAFGHTPAAAMPGLELTGAVLRLLLFGGDGLDAPRHIWWNFVSRRKERIAQAAADWRAQAMGLLVPPACLSLRIGTNPTCL